MADDTPTKTCPRCGEEKPATAECFYRSGEGLRGTCRVCDRAHASAWRAANPERAAAKDAAWRKANPDRVRAYNATFREGHRKELSAAQSARHRANPERGRATTAAWQRANPEKAKALSGASNATRRARKACAPVVEKVSRAAVWERDRGICHVCKRKADPNDWHLEHIVPLARGGEHSYRNCAVSHPA